MRETISREAGGEGMLADAVRRLDRALARLDATLAERTAPPVRDLFPQSDSGLAAELEASRARERALEAAATAASQALGRAAVEVRAVLAAGDEGSNKEEAA